MKTLIAAIFLTSVFSFAVPVYAAINRPVVLLGFLDDGQKITFRVNTGGCFSPDRIVFAKKETDGAVEITLLQEEWECGSGVAQNIVRTYQDLGIEDNKVYKFTNLVLPLTISRSSSLDGFPN